MQRWGHIVGARDRDRLRRLRFVIQRLIERDELERGAQSRLAEHFHVSRQYVHQLVNEERERAALAGDSELAGGSAQGSARSAAPSAS